MANLTDADKVLRNDTGKDIASKLDAIKSAIQNQSTTLNNLSDVSILSVQDGQFLKYNSIEQKWENVSLPDPMVFKGTLGTGGTITALPVDGSANVGDTYKVIEDGTYATVSAKVGDLFSCLTKTSVANTWVLIPSGDESFTDTWRGIKVNGTEKLTSSISSGEVDFVEGSNVQITFDTTGNKIIISATDTTYSEATQSTSGLMSASDKTKLDTIPTTADTQPVTSGSVVNTKEYIDDKTTFAKSASGSLIHITDGGDNIPMKSLESEIVAVESGSGEKSPDNPYTISGFDNGVVSVCGKNLVDTSLCTNRTASGVTSTLNSNGSINLNGTASATARWWHSNDDMTILLKAGTYTTSTNISGVGLTLFTSEGYKSGTFTLTSDMLVTNLIFELEIGRNYNVDVLPQLEVGNQATIYEAYKGNTYTFTFGQTVYGGHFDNKGNLVVTHGKLKISDLTWTRSTSYSNPFFYSLISDGLKNTLAISDKLNCISPTWSENFASVSNNHDFCIGSYSSQIFIRADEYTDATTFSSAGGMGNTEIVYELATPITLSITSQNIPTLSGENNILSNCGDTDIEYFSNTVDELVTLINDFTVKNATELPISDSDPTDTKSYIDTKTTLVKSASGSLIHITDGGDNIPLKSCEIEIAPDLTGHTEANLVVCGKNVCPKVSSTTDSGIIYSVDSDGIITASGQATAGSRIGRIFYLPAGNYILSGASENSSLGNGDIYVSRASDSVVVARDFTGVGTDIPKFTLTEYSRIYLGVRFSSNATVSSSTKVFKPQIEVGNVVTEFEPYNATTYNIPFGQTVTEGGTLDVISGELVVGGVTTQLTPVSPKTISGVNNIYNDCGDTAIEYFTSSADDLAALIEVLSNS